MCSDLAIISAANKEIKPPPENPDFQLAKRIEKRTNEEYERDRKSREDHQRILKSMEEEKLKKMLPPSDKEIEKLINEGILLIGLGKYDDAIKKFDDVILSNTIIPLEAHVYRGEAYRLKGMDEKALEDLNYVLKASSKSDLALGSRAAIYVNKGLIELALNDINLAIAINPRQFYYYFVRGNIYCIKGYYNLAEMDYNQSLSINPYCGPVYNDRGDMYMRQNRFDEAILSYNEAIKINIRDAWAYSRRAVAYKNKGMRNDALNDIKTAINIDPQNNLYKNIQEFIILTQ